MASMPVPPGPLFLLPTHFMTVHSAGTLPHQNYGGDAAGLVRLSCRAARPPCRWTAPKLRTGCMPMATPHASRPVLQRRRLPLRLAAFQPGPRPGPALDTAARPVARCVFEALKEGFALHPHRTRRRCPGGVLNDAHFDFAFEPFDIATLWICVLPHLMVITARAHPLRSVGGRPAHGRAAGLHAALQRGAAEQLMRTQAAGPGGHRAGVTSASTALRTNAGGPPDHKRARLGVLRRLLVRLQRLLAPSLQPCSVCCSTHPPGWAPTMQELRDSTEEFSVVLRDMQGLQERIVAAGRNCGQRAEANSRSLFVLTVVTVLALPINIPGLCWA